MLRRPSPTMIRHQMLMLVECDNKVRASGWGQHEFLAHTDLGYNAARKTQYLKDSIIIVRVVRVKIA